MTDFLLVAGFATFLALAAWLPAWLVYSRSGRRLAAAYRNARQSRQSRRSRQLRKGDR